MKYICELNDKVILGKKGRSLSAPRLTARAVVRNTEGLYAVVHAKNLDLYGLPGGGIENGEDALTAVRREVYEETGCTCDEIQELGIISENCGILDRTLVDYYFVVTSKNVSGELHLTQREIEYGFSVQWHTFDEMVRLIQNQKVERIRSKFIKARDVAALREYADRFL